MIVPHSLRRALTELLDDQPLVYVDCGARDGRIPKPFRSLKNSRYVGIEADPDECARLNAAAREGCQYVAAVLGRARERRRFHLTRNPSCASLLEPNHALMGEFAHVADFFPVDRISDVDTIPLDDCLASNGVPHVDFLELDTQGSELDVLRGAEQLLRDSIIGLQIEVEFAPMYVDQPLFADVDAFLRARGFQLYDLSRYRIRRTALDASVPTRGQLLWGHALYFRDHHQNMPEPLMLRLAVVSVLLDFPDLAAHVLDLVAAQTSDAGVQKAVRKAREALAELAGGGRRNLARLARLSTPPLPGRA